MRIPVTAKRKHITKIMQDSPIRWEMLEDLGLESIGVMLSESFCHDYVFGYRVKEHWYPAFKHRMNMKIPSLLPMGFRIVSDPKNMDIVCYAERANGNLSHTGIWADSHVESKFGVGPVYRHEVGDVPTFYGNSVTFLRKKL